MRGAAYQGAPVAAGSRRPAADCYPDAMNRQIRRAQERKDKKQEKEKERRREERRQRRAESRATRGREKRDDAGEGEAPPRRRGRAPGRFAGALTMATTFFILLQALVPAQEASVFNTLVSAGFYLLFGYFFVLWLLRRGVDRAVPIGLASGAMLGLGVQLAALLRPELSVDLLLAALILPALAIGVFLGRLVYFNAPA